MVRALACGAAGALVLTAAHQLLKTFSRKAPHADALGRQSLTGVLHYLRLPQPKGRNLQNAALAGDLVANSVFYSAASLAGPAKAPIVGSLLGVAAGVGALVAPGPLGLDRKATNRYPSTRAMTVGIYALGGLAAGIACRKLQ
jgi:hypothetical protein